MFQEHHLVLVLVTFTPFGSHQVGPALNGPDCKIVVGGWEIGWDEEVLVGVVDLLLPQVAVAFLSHPSGHQLTDGR